MARVGALRGEHQSRPALSILPVNDVWKGSAEVFHTGDVGVEGSQVEGGRGIGIETDPRCGIISCRIDNGGTGIMPQVNQEFLHEDRTVMNVSAQVPQ
jgi:hypothetical protein